MPFFTLLRMPMWERKMHLQHVYISANFSFLFFFIYANWSIFTHKWVKANFNNHLYRVFQANNRKKRATERVDCWKCLNPRMSVNMDASSCFIWLNSCYFFCNFFFYYSQAHFYFYCSHVLRTDWSFFSDGFFLLCLCFFRVLSIRRSWIFISSMMPHSMIIINGKWICNPANKTKTKPDNVEIYIFALIMWKVNLC